MRIAYFAVGVLVGMLAEKVREYIKTFYVMPGGVIPLNDKYFNALVGKMRDSGIEVE